MAADVLVAVIQERQSLSNCLEPALSGLDRPGDRAFVQAICYGVLRGYWRLDHILGQLTRKPIKDARVRMLALLGLYQLRDMRVKPHAAVSETVSAACNWAKPLLNGILRSYQREQSRLEQIADQDEVSACAHPRWLIERLRRDWPEAFHDILTANNQPPPLTLRVNQLRQTGDACLAQLAEHGLPAHGNPACPSAITLDQPVPIETIPGFRQGELSVQDAAAQFAAEVLQIRPGQRVLDVCAAPGGKTAHILESCPEVGEVVAVDISAERLQRVQDNLDRIGLRAQLLAGDATHPEAWWNGQPFDRILVDAPCSATGVIRRHPDIKLLRQPEDIPELAQTQQRILDAIWPLLAPGGVLVYATCSVLRQENEAVVGQFLREHADAAEAPIIADWGRLAEHGRQILPGEHNMDGFFYARLLKSPAC
jgi:16S rRNA (cytosine967-C5)-methyltransferase